MQKTKFSTVFVPYGALFAFHIIYNSSEELKFIPSHSLCAGRRFPIVFTQKSTILYIRIPRYISNIMRWIHV